MAWRTNAIALCFIVLLILNNRVYCENLGLHTNTPGPLSNILNKATSPKEKQSSDSTNNTAPVTPPEPVSGRGYVCEICQEVVAATTKTYPCTDGEICGFNCGNLCNGVHDEMDDKTLFITNMVDYKAPQTPCRRGKLCKAGLELFLFNDEVRSFIQYLNACQVKPYAICAALHRKFPELRPTCDAKDCRDNKGNLLADQCTGISDYEVLHSDDCETNMECTAVKFPSEERPVSDGCVACYWLVKAFPIFNGLKCSDLPERDVNEKCPIIYKAFNIDKNDIVQLAEEDTAKKQLQKEEERRKNKHRKRMARKEKKKNNRGTMGNSAFLEANEHVSLKQNNRLRNVISSAANAAALADKEKGIPDFPFVLHARDSFQARFKKTFLEYSTYKPWFCDKCTNVCNGGVEDDAAIGCGLADCRGSGSPRLKRRKELIDESKDLEEEEGMKKQLDKCYTTFIQFQGSMKARAVITNNQRDQTVNDLNPVTPELATCMCLGQCPYSATEDTVLEGGLCKYTAEEQMSNMEDLSSIGHKLIYAGDDQGNPIDGKHIFQWTNAQQGFDKFALEKLDEVLPFVGFRKKNDEEAEKLVDPKKCQALAKEE
jgi:hypothetical protein